jgi:membrane protein implicated in regulation of membrane protease activity
MRFLFRAIAGTLIIGALLFLLPFLIVKAFLFFILLSALVRLFIGRRMRSRRFSYARQPISIRGRMRDVEDIHIIE